MFGDTKNATGQMLSIYKFEKYCLDVDYEISCIMMQFHNFFKY